MRSRYARRDNRDIRFPALIYVSRRRDGRHFLSLDHFRVLPLVAAGVN